TELYYNRHRYYDPQLGQYITQDPIGLAGNNPTLYGYVSNPNVWIDPFGLNPFSCVLDDFLSGLGSSENILNTISSGGCGSLATQVQAEIGGQFLTVTPNQSIMPGADFLGPVNSPHGTINNWKNHVAVVQDGMVFDAMTGPNGMPIAEYQAMFEYNDALNFDSSNEIPRGCG
ncbi:MAG: RHS repeat-associated core domain-containing protein, partial [Defluviitaleaceae bacterium]|nr:RHS repeat-associated core domain-containing protein [Defluviitaleaceae bacterium]